VSDSRLQARFNDSTWTLTVQSDGRVRIDEVTFTVDSIEPGVYVVDDGERRRTVAVAGPADDRWISIDGQVFQLEIAAEGRSRKKTRGGGQDSLMAPMPATVVKLLVEPGAEVAEGDTLIVLEAMKMELAIRAPRAGRVGAIRCAVGELVQPGVPLLEMA
jgi:biotin carboxyl carrier protein